MGEGTTFEIFLPCVDDAADDSAAQRGSTTRTGDVAISVVGDDAQDRNGASETLRARDCTVSKARDAMEVTSNPPTAHARSPHTVS